jgi:Mn2+/Fe2+ NRAMP family transporter
MVPLNDWVNPVMTINHPARWDVATLKAAKPIRISNKWIAHGLTFLMVFGPGLIVMEADNDAGAVSTYVQAGEFAAIALALGKLGIDPGFGVLVEAVLTASVLTASDRRWECMVLFLCLLDLAWFAIAFRVHPAGVDVLRHTVVPSLPASGLTANWLFRVIAIVGTTIAPWQLSFQMSCVPDKRLRFSDRNWARLDTFVGAVFTIVVAGCMMLAGNASFQHHWDFTDPAQMGVQLGGIYGRFLRNAILLLMINAAVLGTTTISLSSAWAYGEIRGWAHSLQKPVRGAPEFYTIYALCVMAAAGLVLIPGKPLQLIILSVQVLAGLILPSAIIFLQLLLNDKELLGERLQISAGITLRIRPS